MASESVLSHYWELASPNEATRLKAAGELVKTLVEAQKNHIKQGENKEPLCTDLDYSLKRLAKGLASSRKGARQGFATVLAEVLHQFNCIDTEDILQLLDKHLQVTGNAKSQEERDAYIGHIFGLMSVVRSQNLNNKTKVDECDWLEQVVSTMKQLSEKKTYLREICMKSIVDIIFMISYDVFEHHVLPSVNDFVFGGWSTATPDSLLIALSVKRRFENVLNKKSFKKAWNNVNIIDEANYSKLSNILQESTYVHPNVHCVWDEVFLQIFQENSEYFEGFWRVIIDDGLFKSTHDRKYLGFTLIVKVLPKLQTDQVAVVFSKNVMRSFINNLSSSQSYLHNAAMNLSSSMPNALAENRDPDVAAIVVKQLLGRQGNMQFDQLTKTKTVEILLGKLRGSGLEKLVSWFIESFRSGSTDNTKDEKLSMREVDVIRISILNQILSLSKNKSLCHSGPWKKKILFFLIETTYFECVNKSKDKQMIPLSKQVKDICEQRLFSVLKDLGTPTQERKDKDSKSKNNNNSCDEKQEWMFTIVKHCKDLMASDDYIVSTPLWTENTKKTFEQSLKIITKIHKKHKDSTIIPEDEAFELLLCHMVLQLLTEPKQATEILNELKSCYKNRQEKEKGVSTDEPHWVEVLTEILLSLLTRPSNLIRNVVDEVFTAIAPHLTQDALGIILQAINPKNLGEEEDENLEIIEGSDDEDIDSEDAQEQEDNEDEDNDSNDDDDDDDSDDDGNDVDEAFRAEVQAALGSAALPEDDDEESIDDENLDEESMMQLDDALSAVFKSRAEAMKEKKKKKDTMRTILHFKFRVLDIIEIFIKKQPTNPLVLDLIEPLLSLTWTSLNLKDYQALGERAQGIYKNKLCALKELPSLKDINEKDVHSILEKIVHQAMSAPSLNIVTLITRGCMLIIRVLKGKTQGQPESTSKKRKRKNESETQISKENVGLVDVQRVARLFKEALKDFMEKRNTHLHPVLFTDLIKRFPFLAWELAPALAKNVDSAVNNFRKSQACVMLTLLISHKTSSVGEYLKELASPLQTTFQSILKDSVEPDTTLKAKHFKEVLKLMSKFYKEVNTLNKEEEIIDASLVMKELKQAVNGVLACRSQDIKSTCTRLLAVLGGSSENAEENREPTKKKFKKEIHPNGTQSSDSSQSSPKKIKKKARN